jgi:hypothetical protein
MPETLELHSEKYQESGNQAGSGVRNQLGRPNLSQLAVLIRESVQNSWDARVSSDQQVLYGLDYWDANNTEMGALRDNVFRDTPVDGLDLSSIYKKQSLPMLCVYDRGTIGLTGPTRANVRPDPGVRNNFNNLLRNIGSAEHQKFSGGTYGYGKAALFRSSRVNTIVIHTACMIDGKRQTRLMGMALGQQFDHENVPYTGRHWWGEKPSHLPDDIADPIYDERADEIAAAIGMPPFAAGETGTSLLIIDPEFNPANLEDAVTNVLLWNFWPKMIESDNGPSMKFRFDINGDPVEIPYPSDLRYLRPFIDSLEAVHKSESDSGYQSPPTKLVPVSSVRLKKKLGTIAITPTRDVVVPDDSDDDELGTVPVTAPIRHIALMRRAELVVRYYEGPEHDIEGMHYGGVFITDAGVDEAFASSEPPTHDDWSPNSLEPGDDRMAVNVGLREISSGVNNFARTGSRSVTPNGGGPALGALSESLSDLLPGEVGEAIGGIISGGSPSPGGSGTGATVDGSASGNGAGDGDGASAGAGGVSGGNGNVVMGRRPQIKMSDGGVLESIDGMPVLRVGFEVIAGENSQGMTVAVSATASLDESSGGSSESDAPVGMASPRVIGWVDGTGERLPAGDSISIENSKAGDWAVLVELADSAAARVDLNITESD